MYCPIINSFPFQCGKPFTSNDVITLNGTDEEIESLRTRMEEKRLQQKLEKVMSL